MPDGRPASPIFQVVMGQVLSVELDRWRFNLRSSNTEPLVRLNVETRADTALMQDKTAEVLALLDQYA